MGKRSVIIFICCLSLIMSGCKANKEQNNNFKEIEQPQIRNTLEHNKIEESEFINETYGKFKSIYDKLKIEKLFTYLDSADESVQILAINRLVETYNYLDLKTQAIDKLQTFLNSSNPRIRESAELTNSILNDTVNSPYIYELYDGSVIFTIINEFFDYGSYNRIYMVKDGELTIYTDYSSPHNYIENILLSPNKDKFLVVLASRRSSFIDANDVENNVGGIDLVSTSKNKYAAANNLDLVNRIDGENFTSISNLQWLDDNRISFSSKFYYSSPEQSYITNVIYDFQTQEYYLNL